MKTAAVWIGLAAVLLGPLVVAATSPLLQWRGPAYVVAGFAGIAAMALMVLQPLAIRDRLPGLRPLTSRRLHRWTGAAITLGVLIHVAGLWITSPPDVIDALTFTSPTPFAPWGVVAMWAILISALLAVLRLRGHLRWRRWRALHVPLALTAVTGTAVHALLITGTMAVWTKWVLAAALLAACLSLLRPRP
ncbi:ferric reductase-like transmembrane domain-containing protein [Roseobacter sp. HKCCA0434]|uniref:ferric reductase-like transmembrane domain-containing protein n=1 Tax=Roseobacter sp. HKCCA0434 TaxID=3079297 RepID=UPI002905DEBC|nr:ferric reductase-like transmembrane domain-containing protein [Roseobacter sp. HKCCA0434]